MDDKGAGQRIQVDAALGKGFYTFISIADGRWGEMYAGVRIKAKLRGLCHISKGGGGKRTLYMES